MTEHCEQRCLMVYLTIFRLMRDNGYAPTRKEIALAAGIRRSELEYYLKVLRRENLIANPRKLQNRSIRLTGVASVSARP